MLDPSILSSVHALETPFPARSEIAYGNPLCRARFKPSGTVNSPKRYCADSCKQQASPYPQSGVSVSRTAGRSGNRNTTAGDMKGKRNISIIDFVTDPQLLGLSISKPQETLLRAIYGLPLLKSQHEIWNACTGRESYPRHGFSEATVICGARSGKDSRIACPIASFEAALGNHEKYLTRGERAVIPLVAQDTRGSRIAFSYLRSHFLDSPLLKSMLEDEPLSNEIK